MSHARSKPISAPQAAPLFVTESFILVSCFLSALPRVDGLHPFLSHMGFDGTGLPIRSEPSMAQILVAESDRLIREFIAGILNDFGLDVTVCQDSAEATAFLAMGSIDILLTDLVLRGGEGSRLSHDCAALGVPAITLTGRGFQPGQRKQERPTPLLDKPFRFADLQCVVDAVALCAGAAQRSAAVRRNAA